MGIPSFLLRKLYRRGSLRKVGDGIFALTLQNPLATATVVGPPKVVVNGIVHPASAISAEDLDLESLSPKAPWIFKKGSEIDLTFRGHLLRGGNRIQIEVATEEFGELEIFAEDREAPYCQLPDRHDESE